MKYLKMVGLAVIAAAALAMLLGAGTASATVLCTTELSEGCSSSWDFATGRSLRFNLFPNSSFVFRSTGGAIEDSCTGVYEEPKTEIVLPTTIEWQTTNTGSATETVGGRVPVPNLLWAKCSAETTFNLQEGELEVHRISGTANATVTATGFKATIKNAGISCTYKTGAGLSFGELQGGKSAFLYVNAVVQKEAGGFFCPTTMIWEGTYELVSAPQLYVSKS